MDSGRCFKDFVWDCIWSRCFASRCLVTCCDVVVLCEIVVKDVLLCGGFGFGVGIGVRVKWVLPRRGWAGDRCVAGVLFLEVEL